MGQVNRLLSQIIARRRREIGISQEELAELAGIHRTYVSQLERGLKIPTLSVLINLSRALGISASTIVKQIEEELDGVPVK